MRGGIIHGSIVSVDHSVLVKGDQAVERVLFREVLREIQFCHSDSPFLRAICGAGAF